MVLCASLSCGNTPDDAPRPDVRASAQAVHNESPSAVVSASAVPSASGATPEASPYRALHTFSASTAVFGVKTAVIACSLGCVVPQEAGQFPTLWTVTFDKVFEDRALWPEPAYHRTRLQVWSLGNAKVAFAGDISGVLFAIVHHDYDRGGVGQLPWVHRSGKDGWGMGNGEYPESTHARPLRAHPRKLDDAVAHAPWTGGHYRMAHGASAPPMLAAPNKLAVWDGAQWQQKEAPWSDEVKLQRGASGETIAVARDGVFMISPTGTIAPLALPDGLSGSPAEFVRYELYSISDTPWIVRSAPTGVIVYAPQDRSAWRLPKAEPRPAGPEALPEPKPAKAKGAVSPVPLADAGASDGGAEPVDGGSQDTGRMDAGPANQGETAPEEMPAPSFFHAECKTPFVLFATSPPLMWDKIPEAVRLTRLGDLQDDLTFVEFMRQGTYYYGAQAKTEESAKKLIDAAKAQHVHLRPALQCLDATGRIPDRYAPPAGARIVVLNLTTGERLNLNSGETSGR